MSLMSNIKNLLMLIALLFLLNACGGGSSSPSTKSENSDTLATSITEPAPITTSTLVPEQETKVPEISTGTSLATSTTEPAPITTSALSSEQETKVPEISTGTLLKITSIEEIETAENSAIIKWELTEKAMGQVEWGKTTNYGNFSTKETTFNYSTHIQRISTGLTPNTTYHYRVISEDKDGNVVVSDDRKFTTLGDGTVLSEIAPKENAALTPEQTTASEPSTTAIPDGATVITGLKAGETLASAKNNSNVLNAALAGGNKNLVIPSGTWYTYNTVAVDHDTILTFKGKLQELVHSKNFTKGYRVVLTIGGANVTLNNPHLSQKGIVSKKVGMNACLTIYGSHNTGNITINGGILEWGANNDFQGGRNNTVFNGTIFRDSVEHLIYAHGRNGNGTADGRADGLTFNNCIFERPGNGGVSDMEANHIQIRSYKNVEINNCIIRGKKKTKPSQFGLLATAVDGLTVNDSSFSDYSAGLLFIGEDYGHKTKNVVFNRVTATPDKGTKYIIKSYNSGTAIFNECVINSPLGMSGGTSVFNNCTFKPKSYYMKTANDANVTFHNITWDYSNSTYSKAFVIEDGSTVNFSGNQTKLAPEDGSSFNWDILSTVD